jgi:hypothetical protein
MTTTTTSTQKKSIHPSRDLGGHIIIIIIITHSMDIIDILHTPTMDMDDALNPTVSVTLKKGENFVWCALVRTLA